MQGQGLGRRGHRLSVHRRDAGDAEAGARAEEEGRHQVLSGHPSAPATHPTFLPSDQRGDVPHFCHALLIQLSSLLRLMLSMACSISSRPVSSTDWITCA